MLSILKVQRCISLALPSSYERRKPSDHSRAWTIWHPPLGLSLEPGAGPVWTLTVESPGVTSRHLTEKLGIELCAKSAIQGTA